MLVRVILIALSSGVVFLSPLSFILEYKNTSSRLKQRVCPICSSVNDPSALECVGVNHPNDKPRGLSLDGEVITRSDVRLWGIRILTGLVISTVLLFQSSLLLFMVLLVLSYWLITPHMVGKRNALVAFIFVGGLITLFAVLPTFAPQLHFPALVDSMKKTFHLHDVSVGPFHFRFSSQVYVYWQIGVLCLFVVLLLIGTIATMANYPAYLQKARNTTNMQLKLFLTSVLISLFLLYTLCIIIHLESFTLVLQDFSVIISGILLLSYVGTAVEQSVQNIQRNAFNGLFTQRIQANRVPFPARPGPNEFFLIRLAYGITSSLIYTLNAMVKGIVNVLNVLLFILNSITKLFVTIAELIIYTLLNLLSNIGGSLWGLVVFATAGLRPILFIPIILALSIYLLIVSSQLGIGYIHQGNLNTAVASYDAYFLALALMALSASLYMGLNIYTSFSRELVNVYLGNSIVLFAIYLDVYGLQRRVFGFHSHYGVISILLNVSLGIFLVGYFVYYAFKGRTTKQASLPKGFLGIALILASVALVILLFGLLYLFTHLAFKLPFF